MGEVKERRGHVGLPSFGGLNLCAPVNGDAGEGLGREGKSRCVRIHRGAMAENKEKGKVKGSCH